MFYMLTVKVNVCINFHFLFSMLMESIMLHNRVDDESHLYICIFTPLD